MDELNGAGVALITPFNADGTIDFGSLEKLIDHQIKGGMDYLVSLGTTGETATLSETERKSVWEFTARHAAGRIPLVAGIGGNNTAEIVHQLAAFDTTGYAAILSVSPYYNKPTQEGIYQHYKALSVATPLPLIIYNIPGRTGSNISPETTVRLARDFDNIVATKDASGSFDQFSRIMRDKPAEFLLISGDDPMTLPMMALGAVGIISVVANAFPREIAELARLCRIGDYESARVIHNKLIRITELCFVEGNPAGIKNILTQLGICGGTVRLPLVEVSDATRMAIADELQLLR
ncbi:4-hydroxy-tetrahydrodipicolinate synthase [Parapedobacter lycopersici]|uniref:4-hydroxy-tetrahydrodipicolinate synthase n=1 Tax=Parapedobacter lycopersici TaxID=1864939 RepID=UPI00214D7EFE|nr:4-hydroxy-tetrahydrodipicolinate synthase [Parapedobacter lycopersici]